jgi:hypothetical protein
VYTGVFSTEYRDVNRRVDSTVGRRQGAQTAEATTANTIIIIVIAIVDIDIVKRVVVDGDGDRRRQCRQLSRRA